MTTIELMYLISGILLIGNLLFEKKITVLDLFIALFFLAIPIWNVLVFSVNLIRLFLRWLFKTNGIAISEFLNRRIK